MPSQTQVGRRIRRTREIAGLVMPAVICNGGSYFFINLRIYEDGVVDCWEMVDLDLLAGKIDSGWLVSRVPDGERISVHGLGEWRVRGGNWEFDSTALFEEVKRKLRELNPSLQNLYSFHGSNTKMVGKVRTSVLSMGGPKPVRIDDSDRIERGVYGESLSVFVKEDSKQLYLADLRVFADGFVELGRIPKPQVLNLDELSELAKDGRLVSKPEAGTLVEIYGLGRFELGEESYATPLEDFLLGVQDSALRVRGEPDSVDRCRAAYDSYCEHPSDAGVEKLRQAYEEVPEHLRMFVGDMDTKDIPVRMIIYGDEEIEGWTHRAVARSQGAELPSITVPRPDGDTEK